jgi:hypothetical protein
LPNWTPSITAASPSWSASGCWPPRWRRPFAAWAAFATSYLAIVAIEPLVTYGALRLLKRYEDRPLVATCFSVGALRLA